MMKNHTYGLLLLFALFMSTGCEWRAKRLNERVTLWRNDRIPYGTWYFQKHLHHLFPDAEISVDEESPRADYFFGRKRQSLESKFEDHPKRSAEIVISPQIQPSHEELKALFEFVWQGNHLFLSTFRFSEEMLDSLKLETASRYGYMHFDDSLTVTAMDGNSGEETSFTYPGKSYDNYFSVLDTGYTRVLGRDENGKPNFIRIGYSGGGAIYLHLAPMAFTNFFLLHKSNKQYYDLALSNLPEGMELVAWNDYFRNHVDGEDINNAGNFSRQFRWLLNQPGLAAALWMLLLMFLVIFLFESKRRQRLLPELAPLRNTSLDFVKTIGRLYFQRHDNRNLANKMSAHFLDHIRNRYKIPTSRLDDEFENRLAYKSGIDLQEIRQLLYHVRHLPGQPAVTDEDLLNFNAMLDKFYKLT